MLTESPQWVCSVGHDAHMDVTCGGTGRREVWRARSQTLLVSRRAMCHVTRPSLIDCSTARRSPFTSHAPAVSQRHFARACTAITTVTRRHEHWAVCDASIAHIARRPMHRQCAVPQPRLHGAVPHTCCEQSASGELECRRVWRAVPCLAQPRLTVTRPRRAHHIQHTTLPLGPTYHLLLHTRSPATLLKSIASRCCLRTLIDGCPCWSIRAGGHRHRRGWS